MTAYLRNPLVSAWAFLSVITLVSWGLTRASADSIQPDITVTFGVLVIAAIKVQIVVRYFMEVRHAPRWLKLSTDGWLWSLTGIMLLFYLIKI